MEVNKNFFMMVSYQSNGIPVVSEGRVSINDLTDFGPSGVRQLYRSAIILSPVVRTKDLGQWTCQVDFTSDNGLIVSSSYESNYVINEMEIPGKMCNFLEKSRKFVGYVCFN